VASVASKSYQETSIPECQTRPVRTDFAAALGVQEIITQLLNLWLFIMGARFLNAADFNPQNDSSFYGLPKMFESDNLSPS